MPLIRKKDTAAAIGRTLSGLEKLLKTDPTFPRPIKFGLARQGPVYFDAGELDAWLEAKKAQREEVSA